MRLRLGHAAPVAPQDDGDAATVPSERELGPASDQGARRGGDRRRRDSPTLKQKKRAARKLWKAWKQYKAVVRPRIHAASSIQRAWRSKLYYRKHGRREGDRARAVARILLAEKRRTEHEDLISRRAKLERIKMFKSGKKQVEWKYKKKPPGGLVGDGGDPTLPLKRVTIWTKHDVGVFIALFFTHGMPAWKWWSFHNDVHWKPYYDYFVMRGKTAPAIKRFLTKLFHVSVRTSSCTSFRIALASSSLTIC